jgi:hypothetical protein
LLAFAQARQEDDLAVWKFQRIVMGRDLVFVDLSKDRSFMPDCAVVPWPQYRRQPPNVVSKS